MRKPSSPGAQTVNIWPCILHFQHLTVQEALVCLYCHYLGPVVQSIVRVMKLLVIENTMLLVSFDIKFIR